MAAAMFLCLVSSDLGNKNARGWAHGERQDAVAQAGNDQGLAPPQAIVPGPRNAPGVHRARRNDRVPSMPAYAANPVSVGPGARQETRTPEPRTSSARASVKDSTYAFVAQ